MICPLSAARFLLKKKGRKRNLARALPPQTTSESPTTPIILMYIERFAIMYSSSYNTTPVYLYSMTTARAEPWILGSAAPTALPTSQSLFPGAH